MLVVSIALTPSGYKQPQYLLYRDCMDLNDLPLPPRLRANTHDMQAIQLLLSGSWNG